MYSVTFLLENSLYFTSKSILRNKRKSHQSIQIMFSFSAMIRGEQVSIKDLQAQILKMDADLLKMYHLHTALTPGKRCLLFVSIYVILVPDKHIMTISCQSFCCWWLILPIQSYAKKLKMTETLAHGYTSENTQRELSNEYQHDRV